MNPPAARPSFGVRVARPALTACSLQLRPLLGLRLAGRKKPVFRRRRFHEGCPWPPGTDTGKIKRTLERIKRHLVEEQETVGAVKRKTDGAIS